MASAPTCAYCFLPIILPFELVKKEYRGNYLVKAHYLLLHMSCSREILSLESEMNALMAHATPTYVVIIGFIVLFCVN